MKIDQEKLRDNVISYLIELGWLGPEDAVTSVEYLPESGGILCTMRKYLPHYAKKICQIIDDSLVSTEDSKPIPQHVVYIAGPMTGYENYNYDAFFKAEKDFLARGYRVLNPARLGIIKCFKDWRDYWVVNETMLRGADTIYMLKGWEKSPGACNEYRWAKENNLAEIILE